MKVFLRRGWWCPASLALLLLTGSSEPSTKLDRGRSRNELGITQAKEGDFEGALRSFSLLMAEYPASAVGMNNVANVYFLQGEKERARELYERACEAEPGEGGVYLNLAILLQSLGEHRESAILIRKGIDLIGDPQQAYYMLGLAARPQDIGRGSDIQSPVSAEIDELLADALSEIPSDSTAVEDAEVSLDSGAGELSRAGSTEKDDGRMSTRAGGSKATEIGDSIVADRLFWMTKLGSP